MGMLPPPLSLSLLELTVTAGDGRPDVRSLLTFAAHSGFHAVQLNAAFAGIRPRDLDRSARRDLAALLRRSELACSGLDLFIPPGHFKDPVHADRAVSAVLDAIELAADLARLASSGVVSPGGSGGVRAGGGSGRVVSLILPAETPALSREALAERAETCGVRIADHAWPPAPAQGPIGVGIDPALLLLCGEDPVAQVSRITAGMPAAAGTQDTSGTHVRDRLVSARLCNASSTGRVLLHDRAGRLDLLAYLIALVTAGYPREVVLDLRGTPDPATGAQAAAEAWLNAAPSPGS